MGNRDIQREGATQRKGSRGERFRVSPGLTPIAHCSLVAISRGPLEKTCLWGKGRGEGMAPVCPLEGGLELGPLS